MGCNASVLNEPKSGSHQLNGTSQRSKAVEFAQQRHDLRIACMNHGKGNQKKIIPFTSLDREDSDPDADGGSTYRSIDATPRAYAVTYVPTSSHASERGPVTGTGRMAASSKASAAKAIAPKSVKEVSISRKVRGHQNSEGRIDAYSFPAPRDLGREDEDKEVRRHSFDLDLGSPQPVVNLSTSTRSEQRRQRRSLTGDSIIQNKKHAAYRLEHGSDEGSGSWRAGSSAGGSRGGSSRGGSSRGSSTRLNAHPSDRLTGTSAMLGF